MLVASTARNYLLNIAILELYIVAGIISNSIYIMVSLVFRIVHDNVIYTLNNLY